MYCPLFVISMTLERNCWIQYLKHIFQIIQFRVENTSYAVLCFWAITIKKSKSGDMFLFLYHS